MEAGENKRKYKIKKRKKGDAFFYFAKK